MLPRTSAMKKPPAFLTSVFCVSIMEIVYFLCAQKQKSPLIQGIFVVERVGFEPTCAFTQTDFESCSHLVLSCLLWSVAAVLKTAKTLVLQRISDAPTGIDQLHIRNNQSSN